MHGIQAWVALPTEHEEAEPSFHHHEGADLPEWNERGVRGRLIAGEVEGLKATTQTHSPIFYEHWQMDAGARRNVTQCYFEPAVYCAPLPRRIAQPGGAEKRKGTRIAFRGSDG